MQFNVKSMIVSIVSLLTMTDQRTSSRAAATLVHWMLNLFIRGLASDELRMSSAPPVDSLAVNSRASNRPMSAAPESRRERTKQHAFAQAASRTQPLQPALVQPERLSMRERELNGY